MSDQSANNKRIAEIILSDIMNDVSIASILLKVKIYASKKSDIELLKWVNNELDGYEDTPPKYRMIHSAVKVDIHRGFQTVFGFDYPIEMVKNEDVRNRLSHIAVHNSLSEIEEMSCKDGETVHIDIPVSVWYNHMGYCISGTIQRAYQYANITALKNIVISVKSLLIEYFSKIDENNDIDFSMVMKSKANIIMNYNAAIINTGDGTVNASDITNVIGDNNSVSIESKDALRGILDEITELLDSDNSECNEVVNELSRELSQPSPVKKILKRGFQALKGLLVGASSEVLVGKITPLLEQAWAYLL